MQFDHDQCYAALRARDRRFDGLFFVGVRSTRIYCRSVCPARTPRRDRCQFYATAAGAEQAGFRPCLRCRPELAPGHAPIDASKRRAWSAVARIRAEAARGDRSTLRRVAAQLGCSERQLRRLVRAELGVSPVELLQTSRLLTAKQLLTETRLPVTTIAYAAGFESIRRFNALFASRYRMPPTRLRGAADAAGRQAAPRSTDDALGLTLTYRPPLAWGPLIRFLETHLVPGVEYVEDGRYARTVAIGSARGWFRVTNDADANRLLVELSESLAPVAADVLARIRALFDLDARPDVIDAHLALDPRLATLVREQPGLRVPGAFDGFELGWRTILGQQVSVPAATTMSGRIAAHFGGAIATPIPSLVRLSPERRRFANASPDEYLRLGLTRSRMRTLLAFASLAAARGERGGVTIEPGAPPALLESLRACFGIGPWTIDYLAMRGLRWPDAFPSTDLVLARALKAHVNAPGSTTSSRDVDRLTSSWSPWRAYAAMHLWRSAPRPARGKAKGATSPIQRSHAPRGRTPQRAIKQGSDHEKPKG